MKLSNIKRFSSKGFTLIELLIVIAILGILAAGVLVAINPVQKINQAKDANAKSDVGQIATALQAYFTTNQVYPVDLNTLLTSKELKVLPATTTYTYTRSADTLNASVSYPLFVDPTATLWCWRSSTGIATTVTISAGCPAP